MTTVYINIMPFALSGFTPSLPVPDHVFISCKKSERCSLLIREVADACSVMPSQVVLLSYRNALFSVLAESESLSSHLSFDTCFFAYLVIP